MSVNQKLGIILEDEMVRKLKLENIVVLKMKKNLSIFDIEN